MLALASAVFGSSDPYFDSPRVVVYPFTTSGDTEPTAGGAIATGIADRLSVGNGIRVLPATPGTGRAQYLTNAVAQNADYYVTGFVTTIGREVSLLAQLVSTHSGAVVWSNTWLIATLDDATSHAPAIRDALLHHAGRTLAADATPPPAPAVTPKATPDAGGHVADIFGALEHRPRRAPKSTPKPSAQATGAALALASARPSTAPTQAPGAVPNASASATAAASPLATATALALGPAPMRHVAVLDVGGDAESTARDHASVALVDAFAGVGYTAERAKAPAADARRRARELCAAEPALDAIASATLHVDDRLVAELALTMYDCSGRALSVDAARRAALGRLGFIPVVDDLAARAVRAAARRSPPPANPAGRRAGS